mmetsp:Transcript_6158/g.14845  ORF Transcript_6158/g.14845 Transcript_6158/m.14845 type:complete len:289 (+) Transcript_6158:59-925(+)|eukprot:CAMPEP_0173441584 /NCGR_PEP_ID=MMETSP1357-20121228/24037_1 /TAXON_ID=77926 /ORGANISM="Hemiselmis rufescens, Strain PCC563" /LENGTH=288 /DNA_ID=CAMNT_0014407173 /DNA_START=55 /DNA_END=924 /DNA_ORIENTATION=+
MSRKPPAWQAKRLLEWAKSVLVQLTVKENDFVCDLWCGPGANTAKFLPVKAQFYLGLDPFDECLGPAKKMWAETNKHGSPLEADFRKLDPVTGDYDLVFDGVSAQLGEFDVVTCFGKLQFCWGSEEQAKQFLHNVASVLRPGGLLVGFMPDSEAIWSLCQRGYKGVGGELPHGAGEMFKVKFHGHEQGEFGARYNLQINDGKNAQQFFLVHSHTLMELALVYGLELIEMNNMSCFYQDTSPFFAELLKDQGVLADPYGGSRIGDGAMELFSLYCTFVFRRVEEKSGAV